MTMIAFATYGDHAEFITDSASYLQNGSALGRCSKSVTIPHMDAAVLTQGDSTFGIDAKSAAMQLAAQVASFDELNREFPRHLRDLWQQRLSEFAGACEATAFLIGYSPEHGRFVAWGYSTDRNLEPYRLDAPYVSPCPWSLRPHINEAKRYRLWEKDYAASHGRDSQGADVVNLWMQKPALAPPPNTAAWVDLAKLVREQRALSGHANVYVAGDVFHTRLGQGDVATRKVYTYDDQGAEFLEMISWTQHPIAQVMECWCESGKRFIECHQAPQLDKPCGCGSSAKTFRECCAVDLSMLDAGITA